MVGLTLKLLKSSNVLAAMIIAALLGCDNYIASPSAASDFHYIASTYASAALGFHYTASPALKILRCRR